MTSHTAQDRLLSKQQKECLWEETKNQKINAVEQDLAAGQTKSVLLDHVQCRLSSCGSMISTKMLIEKSTEMISMNSRIAFLILAALLVIES